VPCLRLLLAFVLPLAVLAPGQARPTGLLCQLLTQPGLSVITERKPDFGWIVPWHEPGDRQTAYQILVAATAEALAQERGDLWDTGKVPSAQSINVVYAGKELAPHRRYWWAVRTWDRSGRTSGYSAPQQFHTGEFDREPKQWPGESRWVEIADGAGGRKWTLEDRPPTAYHPQPVGRLERKADGAWFMDFGRAAFAALELTIAWTPSDPARQECTVQIALGEKNRGNAVEPKPGGGIIYGQFPLTLRPGEHTYRLELPRFKPRYPHSQVLPPQMPEVIPFRYGEVLPGAEAVTVTAPRQLALWSQFDDQAAAFTSSDPALNAIYDLCKYSVKVNTFNGDYAASQRERMMYEADSHIHQTSHYAVDREYSIGRYSTANMIFHASWPTEWIPHAVFMAWADYRHTGNVRLLARYYAELPPKTLLALAGPDGLVSTRTGRQTPEFLRSIHFNGKELKDIVDWPTGEADGYVFTETNTVVNAFHYRALVLMEQIARVLGRADDALFYERRAAQVKTASNAAFLEARRGIYVDGRGTDHASLHANLFPLAFGLVPDAHRRTVVDFIKSRGMACSVYPTVFLLEALYDADEAQYALDLMTATSDRSWLNMLRVGSTVTTEAWDIKYKKNSGWTHAWSTAPVQIIPRKLMGIEPLEPGFGRVRIRPRPGDLEHAWVRLPTIRGPIEAEIQQSASASFSLRVQLPANVTAEISVPAPPGPALDVLLDGQVVRGRREGNHLAVGEVGSGVHTVAWRTRP
jgi:hypothetical protein